MNKLKLVGKYVNKKLFILTVYGRHALENKRRVVLEGESHEVNTVKICLLEATDDRFNFKVKNGAGLFIAHKDGKYTLPLTTSQHILTREDAAANYIEVRCSDKEGNVITDYVEVNVL